MRVERTCWLVVGCLLFSALNAEADRFPTASLEATAEPIQAGGAPVIFTLTVRNTGTVPITYWCAGPGDFPDAATYSAWVIPADKPRQWKPATLSNGQSPDASGHSETIVPGVSKTFHSAMQPLPPGGYRITFSCDADGVHSGGHLKVVQWPGMRTTQSVQVEIRDDAALSAHLDQSIIAGVRGNDPFAAHLARTWFRTDVRDALMKDLTGTDPVAADRASEALWQNVPFADDQPPSDLAPAVADAIVHRLTPPRIALTKA
jgi:hypothetical protein